MVYKIGLVSTHGTGKTALAAIVEGELKRRNVEVTVLREMATEAKKLGLSINQETTKDSQLWILHRQFAQEIEYSKGGPGNPKYDAIICDRGPDNYCYLERRFGEDKYALSMTLGHLEKYPFSKLYLLPIVDNTEIKYNGVRDIKADFQEDMDQRIRSFLVTNRIDHQELPIPHQEDNYRDIWTQIIVNQTLKDLGCDKKYLIR